MGVARNLLRPGNKHVIVGPLLIWNFMRLLVLSIEWNKLTNSILLQCNELVQGEGAKLTLTNNGAKPGT